MSMKNCVNGTGIYTESNYRELLKRCIRHCKGDICKAEDLCQDIYLQCVYNENTDAYYRMIEVSI